MKKLSYLFMFQGLFLALEAFMRIIGNESLYPGFNNSIREFRYVAFVIGILLIVAAIGFINKKFYGYYTALFLYLIFNTFAIFKVFYAFYTEEISLFTGAVIISFLVFVLKSITDTEDEFEKSNPRIVNPF